METVDVAITKHFQTASQSSKVKEEEKKSKVHFKLRVVELLDIFFKRQPQSPLILSLLAPLLKVKRVSKSILIHRSTIIICQIANTRRCCWNGSVAY